MGRFMARGGWLCFIAAGLMLTGLFRADRTARGEENAVEQDTLLFGGEILDSWIQAVGEARRTVDVAMYKLTSSRALEALGEAEQRGVRVRLLLDGKEAARKNSLARKARKAGLAVSLWPTDSRGKLHVKLTLIDEETAILGSFNLTTSAERVNREFLLLTADEHILKICKEFLQESFATASTITGP